jgi:hypothetical protein
MKAIQITDRQAVPVETARHILWWFAVDGYGIEPGEFTKRLLSLAAVADEDNIARLSVLWPETMYAFRTARDASWGMDWLRALVHDAEATRAAAFGLPIADDDVEGAS